MHALLRVRVCTSEGWLAREAHSQATQVVALGALGNGDDGSNRQQPDGDKHRLGVVSELGEEGAAAEDLPGDSSQEASSALQNGSAKRERLECMLGCTEALHKNRGTRAWASRRAQCIRTDVLKHELHGLVPLSWRTVTML
eukprot:1162136-Pelagomonas_calceolata.AAC.21